MFLKYSDFLVEKINMKEIAWHRKSSYFAARGYLPFTPRIAKEFYNKKINCFHITGIFELDRFKHLVGKKKSISTFTKMTKKDLTSEFGIQTRFDVLMQIEGNIVAQSDYDMMSSPDENGRRWISINTFINIDKELEKAHQDLLRRTDARFGKEFGMDLINPDIENIEGKKKAEFISWWISEAEKLMIQHKDAIIKSLNDNSDNSKTIEWNEILVNEIEIKDILLISGNKNVKSGKIEDEPSLDYFAKICKEISTGQVYVTTDRQDTVEFFQKRGGIVTP